MIESGNNGTQLSFPEWCEALLASDLSQPRKASFKITIRWYLGWCKRKHVRASVDSIQTFLETIREERKPSSSIFKKWRMALVWFYKEANKGPVIDDVPESLPEPREAWEVKLVKKLRREGLEYSTEKTYRYWCCRFMNFCHPLKPDELSTENLDAFLTHLAVKRRVANGTQKQALNALVFWFRKVKGMEIPEELRFNKARVKKNLPVVLHKKEVKALLAQLSGTYRLMGQLQYGTGMRISDLVRLRVKDIDYANGYILLRFGKGKKDRRVQLPKSLIEPLKDHLAKVEALFKADRADKVAGVYLPSSLERKYPKAGEQWIWHWVYPSRQLSVDPRSGIKRRHHVSTDPFQKQIRRASAKAGISKRITSHVFRHSYATHLLEAGVDIRTVQELLGHKSVETTMIYTHVMMKPGIGVPSPLDQL